MKKSKMRSVGAASPVANATRSKALIGLVLCAGALLAACGQKRPLQLPEEARKHKAAATTPFAAPAPASAASAEIMPAR